MALFENLKGEKLKRIGAAIAKKGVPILASAVTGGVGGKVLNLVANVFGISSDDPDELEKAIASDPQAAAKLKELELTHKVELEKLVIESSRIEAQRDAAYLADVKSARDREIAITKATGKRDKTLYFLAWTVVVGFFVLLGILMFIDLAQGAEGYINQLFGALATGFGMVLSYFFGSSKGSADKNDIISSKNVKGSESGLGNLLSNAKG